MSDGPDLTVIDGGRAPTGAELVEARSQAQIARDVTAQAAADRHLIIRLAVKGLDPYSIALRLANRGDGDGGPLLRTEGEIERILDDFIERTAKADAAAVIRLRSIENKRLDYFLEQLEEAVDNGESAAIKTALAITDRRAKLNGLDAPRKIEHSGKVELGVGINREQIAAEEEAFRTQHEPFIEGSGAEISAGVE